MDSVCTTAWVAIRRGIDETYADMDSVSSLLEFSKLKVEQRDRDRRCSGTTHPVVRYAYVYIAEIARTKEERK